MKSLIISTSLNKSSNSRILANYAHNFAKESNLIDLKDYPLPLCDGCDAYDDKNLAKIKPIIEQAKFIIMTVPVYNFGPSSSAKNIVELAGNAFKEKVIAFMCAAGGRASYMSIMSLANSLMLDFRCLIVPKFVYATKDSFNNTSIIDQEIKNRVEELVESGLKLANAI